MKTLAFVTLGVFLTCVAGAISGFVSVRTANVDLAPVEVMVAARELEAGSKPEARVVTLPAKWTHDSMIRAGEWARVKERALAHEVSAGDALTWQDFARSERFAATERCVLGLHAELERAVNEKVTAELDAFQAATLAPAPPTRPASGQSVRVLVAASELKAGTKLAASSLTAIELPSEFLSESLVLESEAAMLVDATLDEALRPGDVIWWQMVHREGVQGPVACVSKLEALTHTVRDERAKTLAARFEVTP